MRIDKLLASLQVAGLAAASSPIYGVYRRSFNDTGLVNSTSIQSISSSTLSSFAGSSSSSVIVSTASSENSTVFVLTTSTPSTTSSSLTAQLTFTNPENSTSTIEATSSDIANAILASTTVLGTTQKLTSVASAVNATISSTSSAASVVSTTNQSSNGTTTVATTAVTRTAFDNTTVTNISIVNGTATIFATDEITLVPSSSSDVGATATAAPLSNVTAASGSTQGCSSYYVAQSQDSCAKVATIFSMSVASFMELNPSVTSCDSLVTGAAYCVSPHGDAASPSTILSNATLANATTSASMAGAAASTHYALLNGSTVVVAEITSTVVGASMPTNASISSLTNSTANMSSTAQVSAIATSTLASTSTASAVQVLSPTTQTITRVATTTEYLTVDVTKTDYATSTVYLVTVTDYVTKYVTATLAALLPIGQTSTLVTNTCTARTVVITLPASLSPTIVATPGESTSRATLTPVASGSFQPSSSISSSNVPSGVSSTAGTANPVQTVTVSSTTTSGTGASSTSVTFCPSLDGSVWTDAQGDEHFIYCNTDFNGTIIGSNVRINSANGTVGNITVLTNTTISSNDTMSVGLQKRVTVATSLAQCITQCDALSGCVGTSYNGKTCTYFSSLSSSYASSGVEFARVLVSSASSSTSSAAIKAASTSSASKSNTAMTNSASSSGKSSNLVAASTSTPKTSTTSKAATSSIKSSSSSIKPSSTLSTSIKTSSSIKSSTSSKASATSASLKTSTTSSAKTSTTSLKTSTTSSSRASTTSSKASSTSTSLKTSTTSAKASSTSAKASTSSTCATVAPPAPTQTGIVSGCTEWYVAKSGDYCYLIAEQYNINVDTFMAWNPAVNAPSCNNVQIGDAYCVAVGCSSSGTSTTLTSSAGTSTTKTSTSTSTGTTSTSSAVAYKTYKGNGTVAAGWPAMNQWLDFDTLFNLNIPIMQESCENNWQVPNDSANEIADMKAAIKDIGTAQGVDPRFILAIIMQESNGCVRVITTNYGVRNPGLMQDHNGNGTCNDAGVVQNPCPEAEIYQMIEDGTAGTSSGDGLVQCLAETGVTDVSKYYRAARIYNGGIGGYNANDLGTGCCTLCYSSDIANRLVGWSTGVSQCSL